MGKVSRWTGRRIYLDANVFIYALNGFPAYVGPLAELFAAIDDGAASAVTSELSVAEVLVIPFPRRDPEAEARCREILRPRPGLDLAPISLGILESAARMRAAAPSLRTPDAIHAATAQASACDVLLTNDQHLRALNAPPVTFLSALV